MAGQPRVSSGVLVRWRGHELKRWVRRDVSRGVQLVSPALAGRANRAVRLRLRLRPGGARELRILPLGSGEHAQPQQRERRTVILPVETDGRPEEIHSFSVDVADVLQRNWGTTGGDGGLERLEILAVGALPAALVVEEVLLEDSAALYAGVPAGRRIVDRAAVLHPSWFVNSGAAVSFDIAVPPQGAELRWYEAAEGQARRSVSLRASGRQQILVQGPVLSRDWRQASVDLREWAGQLVELKLAATGAGLTFFGDPRVVTRDEAPSTPNVLVYLIDTLRPDHLGFWGNRLDGVSTTLDRLAQEGAVFAWAISSSPWTKPAITSLMTGLLPTVHRVGATSYTDRLPQGIALVQERFRHNGWRTGSFSASPHPSLSGLERGFSTILPPERWRTKLGPLGNPSSAQLQEALLQWVDEESEQPFFAYLHTLEVHEYQRPLYAEPAGSGYTPYDTALRDQDQQLGLLLSQLDQRELGRDLLLVVVSDHGESFGEHGFRGHGYTLYQQEIRVPLIFWSTGAFAPMTQFDPVSLVDVAPTLLDLVGLPPLPGIFGRTLVPYFDGPVHARVPAARLRYPWDLHSPPWHALVSADLRKVIRRGDQVLGFQLHQDPCELRSTVTPGDQVEQLDQWLRSQEQQAYQLRQDVGAPARFSVDAEALEQLRSLGYVE